MGRLLRTLSGCLLAACWGAPLGAQASATPAFRYPMAHEPSPAPSALLLLADGASFSGSTLRLSLGGPALLLGYRPEALAPDETVPLQTPGLWNPADPWTERRASLGLALGGRDWDLRLLYQDEVQRVAGRRREARGLQIELEFSF